MYVWGEEERGGRKGGMKGRRERERVRKGGGGRKAEGGKEGGEGKRPDEWSHVFIIPYSEEDVSCLELVDEVDPE